MWSKPGAPVWHKLSSLRRVASPACPIALTPSLRLRVQYCEPQRAGLLLIGPILTIRHHQRNNDGRFDHLDFMQGPNSVEGIPVRGHQQPNCGGNIEAYRNGERLRRFLSLCQDWVMGEVKVQVKLSNGIDLGMFRRGLISREEVRSVNVEAVVDTGAVRSCLPIDLMEKLGLQVVRHINAQMANDQTQSVAVTEGVDMEILDRLVTEAFLVLGSEVLIGQTALEATDLLVDCNRQQVIPNPAHPNSAVIRIR